MAVMLAMTQRSEWLINMTYLIVEPTDQAAAAVARVRAEQDGRDNGALWVVPLEGPVDE